MIDWVLINGVIMMAPPQGAEGEGGIFGSMFFPLIVIMVLFYFLVIRKEQQRKKEREAMLKNLERGDEVLTAGGIYGKITAVTDKSVTVEIANNVKIKMDRNYVSKAVPKEEVDKGPKGKGK